MAQTNKAAVNVERHQLRAKTIRYRTHLPEPMAHHRTWKAEGCKPDLINRRQRLRFLTTYEPAPCKGSLTHES